MEKETRKVGPPGWVVRIVEALIPAEHRDEIAEDLQELCPGTLQYVSFAARTIVGSLRGRMFDCFDVRLIAGEVSLLYVAFAGAPLVPLAIVMTNALTGLLARDAYIHPARGTAREAVSDAMAGATFLVIAQTFLGVAAPSMVMEGWVMMRGTLIGMAMVSGWRMAFRMAPAGDPGRRRLAECIACDMAAERPVDDRGGGLDLEQSRGGAGRARWQGFLPDSAADVRVRHDLCV